jgi:hypothetical protein
MYIVMDFIFSYLGRTSEIEAKLTMQYKQADRSNLTIF